MKAYLVLAAFLTAGGAAVAEPILECSAVDLGEGWYGYTFTVVGNDDLEKSFFVDMTFQAAETSWVHNGYFWFDGINLSGASIYGAPEPATMCLLACGGLALLRRRR